MADIAPGDFVQLLKAKAGIYGARFKGAVMMVVDLHPSTSRGMLAKCAVAARAEPGRDDETWIRIGDLEPAPPSTH